MHQLKALVFAIAVLSGSLFAQVVPAQGIEKVDLTVMNFCAGIKTILPIAAILAVFISGAVYILGQFMGAETRARAVVWSTTLITGAVIAILIQVIAPSVLTTVYGPGLRCGDTVTNFTSTGGMCGTAWCAAGNFCCGGTCLATMPGQFCCIGYQTTEACSSFAGTGVCCPSGECVSDSDLC